MSSVSKVCMSPGGPEFSPFVQGYWRLAEWGMSSAELLSFISQHVAHGITTVDHAPVYGDPSCESLFGAALKLDPSLRNRLEIVSKCGIENPPEGGGAGAVAYYDSSKGAIIASVEGSLSRLGGDHLDVLLVHRCDFLMQADEVAEAFVALKASGKVRHFGVSNFSPSQFSLLQSRLDAPLVTNQVEINPVNFGVVSDGTLDQLQEGRVRPMAWSCLAGGEIFQGQSAQMIRLRATLEVLREELGAESIDQVIFAWIMQMPSHPVPILGSGNIARVTAALGALDLNLSREQWYRLWVASKGHGVP
ncbi:aldo/keto reductase [Paremcibacter congregatus]|nr:aldo/keto reductase [Paremcibacter congregatus]